MVKKVLIIGAGLGGLSAALRLSKKGFEVTMLEKHNKAGGRLNQLKKKGFTFDLAPTFFSMTYEFKELADSCGIDIPFEFIELDPLYEVNFAGDKKFYRIYKDLNKLSYEFDKIEPGFKERMERYLLSASALFNDVEHTIIKKNFVSIMDFILQMTKVPVRHLPKLYRTLWQELGRYFNSYEVKVIFSLIAFFLGTTPFNTPAIYSILSYTEIQHDGYYNVRGGMYKIVEGLLRELEKDHVHIHYNREIIDYKKSGEKISCLIDNKGEEWDADIYVINSDAAWFRNKIFKRRSYSDEKLLRKKWTLAPFTMYLGIKGTIEKLYHHSYFLRNNFRDYSVKIFRNRIGLDEPYYYVNAVSRLNPESAPEGCESIFILCPVPDLRFKPDWTDRQQVADIIKDDLSQRTDYDIRGNLITETIYDPGDWEKMFNLYKGSGLGLAHNIRQIGGFRPSNKDEEYNNVFYVGSSTVPGTGLPMAVISSKLVMERITNEFSFV